MRFVHLSTLLNLLILISLKLIISKTHLVNGFEFKIECIIRDFTFCNKIQKHMIIVGKKISQELLIFNVINVKVMVYSEPKGECDRY